MWLNGRACFPAVRSLNRCWTSDFRCCHHQRRKLLDEEVPHITRKSSRTTSIEQIRTAFPIQYYSSSLFVRRSFSFTGLQLIGESESKSFSFPRCGCNTGKDNSARSSNRFSVSEMPSAFCWTNKKRSFKSLQSNQRARRKIFEYGNYQTGCLINRGNNIDGEFRWSSSSSHRWIEKKTTPWIKASEPCIRNYLISFIRIHPHPRALLYRSRVQFYRSRISSPLKRVHRRQIGSLIPRESLDKSPLKPAIVKWRCPTISPAKQQGNRRTRTLVERSCLLQHHRRRTNISESHREVNDESRSSSSDELRAGNGWCRIPSAWQRDDRLHCWLSQSYQVKLLFISRRRVIVALRFSDRRVTPEVEPGYLRPMLPRTAPEKGEAWDDIMNDVERAVMPGITHWQHPRFHAYFPAGNSYPSILGEMLSSGLGIVGFSWAASPACTELETIMLDWIGKARRHVFCDYWTKEFSLSFPTGRMMALPISFLPFDPSRSTDDSDDEDEAELSPESDEESNDKNGHTPLTNGDNSHRSKANRHIGGGVLLVREIPWRWAVHRMAPSAI